MFPVVPRGPDKLKNQNPHPSQRQARMGHPASRNFSHRNVVEGIPRFSEVSMRKIFFLVSFVSALIICAIVTSLIVFALASGGPED